MRTTLDPPYNRTWTLTTSGRPTFHIKAQNWLEALGIAMEQAGILYCVERLVLEHRDDGSVVATDVLNNRRVVLQEVGLRRLAG